MTENMQRERAPTDQFTRLARNYFIAIANLITSFCWRGVRRAPAHGVCGTKKATAWKNLGPRACNNGRVGLCFIGLASPGECSHRSLPVVVIIYERG